MAIQERVSNDDYPTLQQKINQLQYERRAHALLSRAESSSMYRMKLALGISAALLLANVLVIVLLK